MKIILWALSLIAEANRTRTPKFLSMPGNYHHILDSKNFEPAPCGTFFSAGCITSGGSRGQKEQVSQQIYTRDVNKANVYNHTAFGDTKAIHFIIEQSAGLFHTSRHTTSFSYFEDKHFLEYGREYRSEAAVFICHTICACHLASKAGPYGKSGNPATWAVHSSLRFWTNGTPIPRMQVHLLLG